MNFFQKAVSSIRDNYQIGVIKILAGCSTSYVYNYYVGKAFLTWREVPSELPEINIAGRNTVLNSNGDVIARVGNETEKP